MYPWPNVIENLCVNFNGVRYTFITVFQLSFVLNAMPDYAIFRLAGFSYLFPGRSGFNFDAISNFFYELLFSDLMIMLPCHGIMLKINFVQVMVLYRQTSVVSRLKFCNDHVVELTWEPNKNFYGTEVAMENMLMTLASNTMTRPAKSYPPLTPTTGQHREVPHKIRTRLLTEFKIIRKSRGYVDG